MRFVESSHEGVSFKYKWNDFDVICIYFDHYGSRKVVLYDVFLDEKTIYTYRHFTRIIKKVGENNV